MPLSMVEEGEPKTIVKVGGNMILKVKDSRVALGRDMASKIQVA